MARREKFYKISERTLLELLAASRKLDCLEIDGVDNWTGYMVSRAEYLAETIGVEVEDVHELDLDFWDAAKDDLKGYEQIKEQ